MDVGEVVLNRGNHRPGAPMRMAGVAGVVVSVRDKG
jgi:hypothetical protein